MKPCFVLFAVLSGCVLYAEAFSKCDESILKKIKESGPKLTPLEIKVKAEFSKPEFVIASTPFYFPAGTDCVFTKLDKDKFTVKSFPSLGKPKTEELKLKEHDGKFYHEEDGVKIYTSIWFHKDGVTGVYTCGDKEPKQKLEDSIPDFCIKVTEGYKKEALEGAKKEADEKYNAILASDYDEKKCLEKAEKEKKEKKGEKK